jgi:uncharacterized protein (DUF1330 family)
LPRAAQCANVARRAPTRDAFKETIMAKGYWIAHVTVRDSARYPEYQAANTVAFKKYGARFIVRGGRSTLVEGKLHDRHVVLAFDSYADALACYNSPEYAAALAIRKEIADADITIVEGVD